MEIPSLPTDNLYKFKALSGIVIGILFLGILFYSMYIIQMKISEIANRQNILKVKLKHSGTNIENERNYIKDLEFLLNEKKEFLNQKYKNSINDEYFKDYEKLINGKSEINEKIHDKKSQMLENLNKIELEVEIDSNEIKELDKIIDYFIFLSIVCSIGAVLGFSSAREGFKLWQTKLQDHLDKNIERMNSNKILYKRRHNFR